MSDYCPKCGGSERIKRGIVQKAQRWKCKDFGCRFTKSSGRGYPPETRHFALKLYLEGLGFRAIEHILNLTYGFIPRSLGRDWRSEAND